MNADAPGLTVPVETTVSVATALSPTAVRPGEVEYVAGRGWASRFAQSLPPAVGTLDGDGGRRQAVEAE